MRQEMMGFWDTAASAGPYTTSTLLQTDNHTNTSSLNFYMPDALPDAKKITVSKRLRILMRGHIRRGNNFHWENLI